MGSPHNKAQTNQDNASMGSLLSKIPKWWPIAVFFIMAALALAENRWRLENHLDKEEAESAKWEKLQWEAIGKLNEHAYRAEERMKYHDQRIENLEGTR